MLEALIVEDNLYLANTIQYLLKSEKIKAHIASSLKKAYQSLATQHFDVVLLDLSLGDGSGLELAKYLRQETENTKIIIISQHYEVDQRVAGLEAGADDYISKPFAKKELLLRLDKVFRLQSVKVKNRLSCGEIELSPSDGVLKLGRKTKKLRRKECQMLSCLLKYKNQVVSRQTIIKNVWGTEEFPANTTIDVYIKRLRKLLENDGYISTIRGYGYVIKDSGT